MERYEIQQALSEIGMWLEFRGENPFKARAYTEAARALGHLDKDIGRAIRDGTLRSLPGVGPVLAGKITALHETGSLPLYERLRTEFPRGLLGIMELPGIGPRKTRQLYDSLGISTVEALEEACRGGKVAGLSGFGQRTQARILREIVFRREGDGQVLLPDALEFAGHLARVFEAVPGVQSVVPVGAIRRHAPIVGCISLLIVTSDPYPLNEVCSRMTGASVVTHHEKGVTIELPGNLPVSVFWCGEEQVAAALLIHTGSPAHVESLQRAASHQGLSLTEDGLTEKGVPICVGTEEELYQRLGLEFVPPELREDAGEMEAARSNGLPQLIDLKDLRGVLHVHTSWSDGRVSLEDMIEGVRRAGFRYVCICEHSRSAVYAGGMSVESVRRQWEAIDRLNAADSGFTILKGIESDILADGSLDYPDDLLAGFDIVIGSVHSHFKMERDCMTARILKAMSNPYLDIVGHPTGRMLLHRSGYEVDLEAVIESAERNRVCLELNANPHRLDLDERWCRAARERSIPVTVGVDAHSVSELQHIRYGVWAARRGWLGPKEVPNTRNADELVKFLRARRKIRE